MSLVFVDVVPFLLAALQQERCQNRVARWLPKKI